MVLRRLTVWTRWSLVFVVLISWLGMFGIQTSYASSQSGQPAQASTPLPSPTSTPPSTTTGLVTLEVTSDPAKISLGELVTVNITISGDSSQCGQSVVIKPLDTYLVLDHSGSMEGEKMEQAISASGAFVDTMDFSFDRMGIVQFDDSAQVIQPITNQPTDIKNTINAIEVAGGTDVAAGLQAAYEALKTQRRADAIPVIIVLSDGQSDVSSIEHVASAAKAAGMVIVSIGLGDDVDENAMRNMASLNENGKSLYFPAPDASQLDDIYQDIARAIRKYGLAKNITLRFQADIYQFQIIPDSISPAGNLAGDTITWQKEILDDGETVFSFQTRARNVGDHTVGQVIEASFLECEQNDKSLSLKAAPLVTISQISDPPPVPLECEKAQTFPWWILAPLVLILLILLFSLTPPGRAFWSSLSKKTLLCKLLSLLWLLTLLAFSAFLAQALMPEPCRSHDLYFWKLTASGDVGIYQTKFDGDTASEVNRLNNNSNCVACHEVSSANLVAGVRDEQNGEVAVIHHNGDSIPLPAVRASYLAWSPDGKWLALSYEDQDIYILEIATGNLTPLPGASDSGVVETMPAWAPDGKTIAFVRARQTAPPPDTAEINVPCDIYTVPFVDANAPLPQNPGEAPSQRNIQALPLPGASGDGFNYYPAYSPDGKWLAFTRHLSGSDTYADDAADIYVIPAAGTQKAVRLKINSEYADSWPTWSPDSKWLGFGSNRRDGQFDILVSPIGDNGLPYEKQYDDQGNRSSVFKITSAAMPQDEEFHPVWVGIRKQTSEERLLALWPWLIPLLLLPILLLFVCPARKYTLQVEVVDGLSNRPIDNAEVTFERSNYGG